LQTEDQAQRVLEEFSDRYGATPVEVRDLIRFSVLKSFAERLGVESIDRRQSFANVKFHMQSKVDPMRLMDLVRRTDGSQFTPAGVLKLPIRQHAPAALIAELQEKLQQLETAPVA
jgi:transcription-repair coupling factor (superfamily II helicase)